MSESNGHSEPSIGGQGVLAVLSDEHHERADLRLIGRAVRERWPVTARETIVGRMLEVVEKRVVSVMTKAGPAVLDGPADTNAVSAARVLVAMEAQNQSDEHKLLDKTAPDQHEHTHVALTDAQRLAKEQRAMEILLERARLIDVQPGKNGHGA